MLKLPAFTLLTVFALILIFPDLASAATREEMVITSREQKIAPTNTIRTNQMERKVVRKEEQGERRDGQLEKIASRVETRFKNQAAWLTRWIERAKAQIERQQAQGKNVRAALAALATAQSDLDKAKSLGDAAVAALKAVQPTTWNEQKAEAKAARQAVVTAEKAFAQVLRDLGQVVKELRQLTSS